MLFSPFFLHMTTQQDERLDGEQAADSDSHNNNRACKAKPSEQPVMNTTTMPLFLNILVLRPKGKTLLLEVGTMQTPFPPNAYPPKSLSKEPCRGTPWFG